MGKEEAIIMEGWDPLSASRQRVGWANPLAAFQHGEKALYLKESIESTRSITLPTMQESLRVST